MKQQYYKTIFVQQKINEFKIALFRPEPDAAAGIPNNIIRTIKVEDDGIIWFMTACRSHYELEQLMSKPFFAYLDYYKKGIDCLLRVSGKANIVAEENGVFTTMQAGNCYRAVLIQMKMMHAEFYEKRNLLKVPWLQRMKEEISHLFLPRLREYHYS